MSDAVRFEETQRFRSPWVWAAVIVAALPLWILVGIQVFTGRAIGDAPAWVLWVFFLLLGVGLPLLFLTLRLRVRVNDEHLRIRFRPFPAKIVPHDEIQAAEAVTYSPLGQFGGWGLRYRPGFGWAYNIAGNRGVIVTLTDGQQMLIGSQRAEALADALEKAADKPVG